MATKTGLEGSYRVGLIRSTDKVEQTETLGEFEGPTALADAERLRVGWMLGRRRERDRADRSIVAIVTVDRTTGKTVRRGVSAA